MEEKKKKAWAKFQRSEGQFCKEDVKTWQELLNKRISCFNPHSYCQLSSWAWAYQHYLLFVFHKTCVGSEYFYSSSMTSAAKALFEEVLDSLTKIAWLKAICPSRIKQPVPGQMFAGLGSDGAITATPDEIPADSEGKELTLSSFGSKEHWGIEPATSMLCQGFNVATNTQNGSESQTWAEL